MQAALWNTALSDRAWSLHARQPLLAARLLCPAAASAGGDGVRALYAARVCQHTGMHAAMRDWVRAL